MLISLCHATFYSKKKPNEIKELWLKNSYHRDSIEYIPGLNKDDLEAVNDTEGMNRFISIETDFCTAVNNWNGAASISKGDILFAIADDLMPSKGWDKKLRELLINLNPRKYHFAIKINDSNSNFDTKMRHPIISRKYYEKFGLFDNKFRGVFCDDDITNTAFWKSLIIDGREIKIEHNNGNENKGKDFKISISTININKKSEYEYGFKIIQEKWSYKRLIAKKILFKKKPNFLNEKFYFNLTKFVRIFSLILLFFNFKEVFIAIYKKLGKLKY